MCAAICREVKPRMPKASSEETAEGSLLPAGGALAKEAPAEPRKTLDAEDAVDIWILRWLGVRRKDIVARYGCDPRRLYEIWWEERFVGSRARASEVFRERYPGLVDRVTFVPYRRVRRASASDAQGRLFE
jgi:hypothetical protein